MTAPRRRTGGALTNNSGFTYPGIELWDKEAWKGRESVLYPLAMWLEENNQRLVRGKGHCERRTDAPMFQKTKAYIYPEMVEELDKMGLRFRHDGLGGEYWVIIAPKTAGRGGNRCPRFLVVMHDADYANPYWIMEAMDYYRDYNRMAAEEGICVLYCVTDGRDEDCLYSNILCEMHAIFHVDLDRLYVDVTNVYKDGKTLRDIPGFVYRDKDGAVIDDPDSRVEYWGDCRIPTLDFSGRWFNRISHTRNVASSPKYVHPCFDREKLIHSETGHEMVKGFRLEHDAMNGADEVMGRYWEQRGLSFERHDCKGEQWISVVPSVATRKSGVRLPLFLIFQEVSRCDDYQELIAIANYRRFFELAAAGECAVALFALETKEDNELMDSVLTDALALYPIDQRRVYLVGHSHNSRFAQIFAYDHPKRIAGLAMLNASHGMQDPRRPGGDIVIGESELDKMARWDMPQIIINGYAESDFTAENVDRFGGEETAVRCWQNRLRACRCPVKTGEEIRAARESGSMVERKMGLAADRTQVDYLFGYNALTADVKNSDGKWHLRCVTLEALPHMITPQMPDLTFKYLRRFARRPDGTVEEMFE